MFPPYKNDDIILYAETSRPRWLAVMGCVLFRPTGVNPFLTDG